MILYMHTQMKHVDSVHVQCVACPPCLCVPCVPPHPFRLVWWVALVPASHLWCRPCSAWLSLREWWRLMGCPSLHWDCMMWGRRSPSYHRSGLLLVPAVHNVTNPTTSPFVHVFRILCSSVAAWGTTWTHFGNTAMRRFGLALNRYREGVCMW